MIIKETNTHIWVQLLGQNRSFIDLTS